MTKFAQLLASGVALGSIYALVCLGFVVIYRATGVINFAQAALVLVGAYVTYSASVVWGLGFFGGLGVACVFGALLGILIERFGLRAMSRQPLHAVVLMTVGILLLLIPIVTTIWPTDTTPRDITTPFRLDRLDNNWSVKITQIDAVTVAIAAIVLLAFFAFFRFTRYGVAMRATAVDREAALMQGINVNVIVAMSWAIAGAVGVLGGAMLAADASPKVGLQGLILLVALRALPAMVLGGLDSAGGAVLGGLVIGASELLLKGYQAEIASGWLGRQIGAPDWLQASFATDALPWIIMLVVLLVRPFGLFGTRQVQRL